MKKIYTILIAVLLTMSQVACNSSKQITPPAEVKPQKIQDVQIFTSTNTDAKITTLSIEEAFDANGLSVPGNNNMNKPFETRFANVHYKVYNLAMYINEELTYKLIKKYPSFGALTPLTMSIWESKDGSMNISTLTVHGMARATGIPIGDPDLVVYGALIHKALQAAMPNGKFKELEYTVQFPNKTLATNFEMAVEYEQAQSPDEFIEDFEAEFEGEMEPLGFLLPNYTNVQEEIFDDRGYTGIYDFYHTYSICKFDVIYAVSKNHPEAGAWAPCSFFLYKKANEDKMHMGFLSVENWISTMGMSDEEEGTKKLREAQGYIETIINGMTE